MFFGYKVLAPHTYPLGNINSPRLGCRSFHTICVGAASGNNDVRHTFPSCNLIIINIIIIPLMQRHHHCHHIPLHCHHHHHDHDYSELCSLSLKLANLFMIFFDTIIILIITKLICDKDILLQL